MKKKYEGVVKKINSQINVFNKNDFKINLYNYSQNTNLITKVFKLLPIDFVTKTDYQDCFNNKDFFYIRRMPFNSKFIKLLKKIKKNNPNSKILLELPTYPYENENSRKLLFLFVKLKDKYYRKKLKKFVDRIITYSNDQRIFDIQTLQISNGVGMSNIRTVKNTKINNSIEVIAVAMMAYWHGYDRFIEGLGNYYKNGGERLINLHIVGDGKVIPYYKKLVKNYNIQNRVFFHGKKFGNELNELYDEADIALDALGRHRSNVSYNSSLKGKEYAAKGLPIISGVKTELDYDDSFNYYLRFPANEDSIDMEKVIKFYDQIYKRYNRDKVIQEIRDYAETHFNIEVCMKPILNYLNT